MPGCSLNAGRDLVRRTLRLVQGHPKLIELAEQQAADPQRLAAQLDRAEAAPGSGELDAFFRDGETRLDPTMFMDRLRDWTVGIAGMLPEAARIFFYFLCALEEDDRKDQIIRWNWADLWRRLGRPEPAPEIMAALEPLATAALVEKQPDTEFGEDGFAVLIHPGVAEAGRCEAGAEFQRAVDLELAATWNTLMQTARDAYGKAPWAGGLIIRAGLAAFPYLARLRVCTQNGFASQELF